MDISLILKAAGIGLIVSVVCQILSKSGREEQAMLVSVAGVIIVILMLVKEIGTLIDTIRRIFGL
ncbi:MAG: stage III sporulation protein AC [Clostridia bacterium]|nr:stage III sporulation protein AC [Clostridia bacterium]